MKEFLLYKVVPLLILAIFIMTMKSGDFLKKSFTDEDDVMQYVELVNQSIDDGDWATADKNIKDTKDAFLIVQKRIQFSVEKSELNRMGAAIYRAIGYVDEQDAAGAKAELQEIRFTWDGLGK
ncbi:DUF4363 family protein [Cytobacillus purgationiresistens]|uniref:Alpha-1,2-mannosidase n=1 Tax=Cytobacillus purgationiresistens TaxID=863449 RepID=A0ABU0ABS1_9BACI|nr:DUF4363 family protein [Cytobacillus purgationiresistens]MDQ0268324.1 putative alpha-1,2-mannosidase [Cytobacillus purgationiresistens]